MKFLTLSACAFLFTSVAGLPQARADFGLIVSFNDVAFVGMSSGGQEYGKIPAGENFSISYVRNRSQFGLHETPVRLEVCYSIDGTEKSPIVVKNNFAPADGRIGFNTDFRIPQEASGELAIWFKFTTSDGRVVYDSKQGANYRALIVPAEAPVIRFGVEAGGALARPELDGALGAGSELRVAYDYARLASLGLSTDSQQTYVTAYLNFRDAQGKIIAVGKSPVSPDALSDSTVIPARASSVDVYFIAVNHGTVKYDSNFGKNYSFQIVQ